jgi:hypothetical protein
MQFIPTTYCVFTFAGENGRASSSRIGVLGTHPDTKNLKKRFNAFAKIYYGHHGWRVYTTDHNANTIYDTDKDDWLHPEVRKVRRSKEPLLLIGHLNSPQGISELEKRLKGYKP